MSDQIAVLAVTRTAHPVHQPAPGWMEVAVHLSTRPSQEWIERFAARVFAPDEWRLGDPPALLGTDIKFCCGVLQENSRMDEVTAAIAAVNASFEQQSAASVAL